MQLYGTNRRSYFPDDFAAITEFFLNATFLATQKVTDKSRDKSQAQAATTWGGGDPGSSLTNMTYNKA